MKKIFRKYFLITGSISCFLFFIFSIIVKKKLFQQIDFDFTVKLQDKLPHRVDTPFSILSLLGSFEVTSAILIVIGIAFLIIKRKFFLSFGLFFVAIFIEVLGKYFIYHPAPPFFMVRYDLGLTFPSSYVHTNYSYPSGHMTRTIFLSMIIAYFIYDKITNKYLKWAGIFCSFMFSALMFISRVYLAEHWLSDVIGGFFLGLGFSLFALFLYPSSKEKLPL